MTNKEAIQILRSIRVYDIYPKSASEETKQALDMAIKALEERPTGKWIEHDFKTCGGLGDWDYKCSNCEKVYCGKFNYCPNCGSRMKGAEE